MTEGGRLTLAEKGYLPNKRSVYAKSLLYTLLMINNTIYE